MLLVAHCVYDGRFLDEFLLAHAVPDLFALPLSAELDVLKAEVNASESDTCGYYLDIKPELPRLQVNSRGHTAVTSRSHLCCFDACVL